MVLHEFALESLEYFIVVFALTAFLRRKPLDSLQIAPILNDLLLFLTDSLLLLFDSHLQLLDSILSLLLDFPQQVNILSHKTGQLTVLHFIVLMLLDVQHECVETVHKRILRQLLQRTLTC